MVGSCAAAAMHVAGYGRGVTTLQASFQCCWAVVQDGCTVRVLLPVLPNLWTSAVKR